MLRYRLLALLSVVAAVVVSGAAASSAHADVQWLCRPGLASDPCEIPLDTGKQAADGSVTVVSPTRAPEAQRPVDCFYVYPTVSNQARGNATKSRDPELVSIAKYQAARYSQLCRIYAPIYRQATLAALQGLFKADVDESYADVAEAFADYLEHDNHGRGFVLLGHSQGSFMLRALIRRVIDRDPSLRQRLVGAMLLGGNVVVRQGQTTGGDAQHVPICTRRDEFGCIVGYSSFDDDPPANSFWGNTGKSAAPSLLADEPRGPAYAVACTDPGVLSGNTAPIGLTFPSEPFAPGLILPGIVATSPGAVPSATTTWTETKDRYTGHCATINGSTVFRYEPTPGSQRLRPYPDATWGTHLADMQLGLDEQLTTIARRQITAWTAARSEPTAPGARIRRIRVGRTVRLTVASTGATISGARLEIRRRSTLVARRTLKRLTSRPRTVVFRIGHRPAGAYTVRIVVQKQTLATRRFHVG